MISTAICVNNWLELGLPKVDAVRPAKCETCSANAGVLGSRRIVGHGTVLRRLQRLGDDESVEDIELELRRYRCLGCKHVMQVGPRELRSRFRYGVCMIVLALARWATGESETELRGFFSDCNAPSCTTGRWPVLRRWVHVATQLFGAAIPLFKRGGARGSAAQLTRWIGEQCGHPDSELPPLERVVRAVRTIVF